MMRDTNLVPLRGRDVRGARAPRRTTPQSLHKRIVRMLAYAPNEYYILDWQTLRILYANLTAVNAIGYSGSELTTMSVLQLMPEASERGLRYCLDDVRERRRTVPLETVYRRSDGTVYPVEIRFTFARSHTSQIVIADVRDISARHAVEHAQRTREERFRALVQHALDIIIVTGADGDVRYASPSVERVLGVFAEELYDSCAASLFHEIEHSHVKRLIAQSLQTTLPVGPYVFHAQHRDGSERFLETTVTNLLHDPNIDGILISARDVTQQHRVEDMLRRQNEFFGALHETTLGLMNRLEPDELLDVIAARAAAVAGTPHAYVCLMARNGVELEIRVRRGMFVDGLITRIRRGEGIAGRVWESGEPLIVENYDQWSGRIPSIAYQKPVALVCVPLKSGPSVIGVLGIGHVNPHRAFDASYLDRLTSFAQLASIALDNALLYAASQREIAERKQIEASMNEERLRLQQVIVTAPMAMAMFDREMRYIAYSNKWLVANGLEGHNLLTRSHYDVFPDLPEKWKQIYQQVLAGSTYEHPEEIFEREDGTINYVRWAMTPWYTSDGEIGGAVMVTDVIDELVMAREAAMEASRLKSAFLATVSHEIRTPMNGVIGMTDLLLDTPLNAQQQEYALIVRDSAHSLMTIIDDILDFSKAEANKLTLAMTDFDLPQVIDAAVALVGGRAQQKGIALGARTTEESRTFVYGDPVRLRQVLLNLLSNAVKFTDHGGVMLDVSVPPPTSRKRMVRFKVSDTGIGIPKHARPSLFEPFTQADGSWTRRYGGTGLGLAISKRLVELMGGTIQVESIEGVGSTFSFDIPLELGDATRLGVDAAGSSQPVPSVPDVPPTATAAGVPPRVLVVEDNAVNQRVARRQLEKLGCSVTVAGNGREAVDAVAKQRFDLVLMDCHMPVMDGFTAARTIRANERAAVPCPPDDPSAAGGEKSVARHLPIIALTANALPEHQHACFAAGMDDYLSKPVDWSRLRAMIGRWSGWHGPDIGCDDGAEAPPAISRQTGIQEQRMSEESQPFDDSPLDMEIIESLRAMDEDGVGLLGELVAMYRADAPTRIATMREASASGDIQAMRNAAHTLKGSSANLGAAELADAASRVELLARQGSTEGVEPLVEQVEAEYDRVMRAFDRLLAT